MTFKNFKTVKLIMGYISALGQVQSYTHCAYFNVKAKTNSGSTKITVSYLEPSSGRTLRAHTTITVFSPLEVVYPVKEHKHEAKRTLLLPIGSSSKFVLTGGPRPWHGMPTAHFKQSKYIIFFPPFYLGILCIIFAQYFY